MWNHRGVAALALAAVGLGVSAASQAPATAGESAPEAVARLTAARPVSLVRLPALSRDSSRAIESRAVEGPVAGSADLQLRQRRVAARQARLRAAAIARNAWHLPIPSGSYELTARFGQIGAQWSSFHTGLDFAAPVGTPIHAVSRGVIISAGWDGSYGYLTRERLPNGTILYYAHQNELRVHPGEQVSGNQVIGYVGATGNVTGPHVHLEVRPRPGHPVTRSPPWSATASTPEPSGEPGPFDELRVRLSPHGP